MASGPAPKSNPARRNKQTTHELTSASVMARELPKSVPASTAGAKRFWKTWASSPQTAHWLETDWTELEITTALVNAFYQGEVKLAGEIRQRVAKWGATAEDRARLRMSFEKKDDGQDDEPRQGAESEENVFDLELYKQLGGQ